MKPDPSHYLVVLDAMVPPPCAVVVYCPDCAALARANPHDKRYSNVHEVWLDTSSDRDEHLPYRCLVSGRQFSIDGYTEPLTNG